MRVLRPTTRGAYMVGGVATGIGTPTPSDSWDEQYLQTGLDDGLQYELNGGVYSPSQIAAHNSPDSIVWTSDGTGSFVRFTHDTTARVLSASRSFSAIEDVRQICFQVDIRRWGDDNPKEFKMWYQHSGTPVEAFTWGPQAFGYTATRIATLYNDGYGSGGDCTVEITGAKGVGGFRAPARTPLATEVVNAPSGTVQAKDGNWYTLKFWWKANDPYDTNNGEWAYWLNGTLQQHWKDLFNTQNNASDAYRVIRYLSLFAYGYTTAAPYYMDYRNFYISYTRPSELT